MITKTIVIRPIHLVVAVSLSANLILLVLFLREKAHSSLAIHTINQINQKLSISLDSVQKHKSIINWNKVAIKNRKDYESKGYANIKTDRAILNRCDHELRRLRRSYTVLKEDLRKRSLRLADKESRLCSPSGERKVSMDLKFPTQYDN